MQKDLEEEFNRALRKVDLPEFARNSLQNLCKFQGLNFEEVKKATLDVFNSDFVQKDPQFTSDDTRWRYTLAVINNRYMSRMPVKQYKVMPVGFTGLTLTRTKGNPRCTVFAITQCLVGEKQPKLRGIVCQGKFAEIYRQMTFNTIYPNVELTQFKAGNLGVDDRAKFVNPAQLVKSTEVLAKIEKEGWAKRITCAETLTNPSRKQPDSKFLDELDWRIIRAAIQSHGIGKRPDNTEYGRYSVGDYSTLPNGAPFGLMTIWCPPELVIYEEPDECDFVGTVVVGKEGLSASMNAYMIVPVHVMKKAE